MIWVTACDYIFGKCRFNFFAKIHEPWIFWSNEEFIYRSDRSDRSDRFVFSCTVFFKAIYLRKVCFVAVLSPCLLHRELQDIREHICDCMALHG